MKPQFIYMYQSHLDLFWLGNYHTCLEQGNYVIKQYIDRCREHSDETYLIETVVFLRHFLQCYPEYKEIVRELWQQGRIDIGCAYVDVWQNLVLGESHIRNVTEGRNWLKRELGIDVKQAVHPDLPGLTPQTPQIYAKAGVETYITVRKIFGTGQVWVYESPDDSQLLVLNQPIHYEFRPFEDDEQITFNRDWGVIYPDRTLAGFPLGTVLLSAGSSDLTSMETFEARLGHSAREIIDDYGRRYPQYQFRFGSYRLELEEYKKLQETLPHRKGEIPSVWGVACDESVRFFQAARHLEGKLLAAGMLEAAGKLFGFDPIAAEREEWNGIFFEEAHFRPKDHIPYGQELQSLWNMHIFTQDHNGGGQEGALSEFQKRTIQERATAYADLIIYRQLGEIAGRLAEPADILLFNPLNRLRYEPMELNIPRAWVEASVPLRLHMADGTPVPWQAARTEADSSGPQVRIALAAPLEGMGYATITKGDGLTATPAEPHSAAYSIREDEDSLRVVTKNISLSVDKQTGAIASLLDRLTGTDWGSKAVNRIYAVTETGNDVTLRVDETSATAEAVHQVKVTDSSPLFVRIGVIKEILKARVEQEITIWLQEVDMVDVETTIYWHGQHDLQLRQGLPSAVHKQDVTYGTPFHATGWMDVAEGCTPNSPDELQSEDYPLYREIQMWLHQKQNGGGLAIATSQPGVHWGEEGLEAVLMRTPSSCGDSRFYWENAGKQHYLFRMKFGTVDDTGWAFDLGQRLLCPVIGTLPLESAVQVKPAGDRAAKDTFVRLDEENLILSAVYPDGDQVIVRFFETKGRLTETILKMPYIQSLERMTLDGRALEAVENTGDGWRIRVNPFEIVTLRANI